MANEIVASVNNRITEMQKNEGLKLPANYSPSNALNSAWLTLSDNSKGPSLLDKTTPQSQAKALLNMVIQGLSPAKNQVYFIPYGKDLTLMRSYFGSLAILKRLDNVQDVWAEVVREGDKFQIGSDRGRTVVKVFEPRIENQDNAIAAAFAVIVDNNGVENFTIMTKKQIDQSWSHAKTKKVQQEFPEEMAKRTVLNRAAKFFINSSSDNDLLLGAVNDTTADEYDNAEPKDVTPNFDDLIDSKPKEESKHAANAKETKDTKPKETSQPDRAEHRPVTDKEVANLFQNQANK